MAKEQDNSRTNKTLQLAALVGKHLQTLSPVASQLTATHRKILAVNDKPRTGTTIEQFREIIGWIIVQHGVKVIPSQDEADLLCSTWNEAYSKRMNVSELRLALSMNLAGEFTGEEGAAEIIKPFGLVSMEFLGKVCLAYLEKKAAAIRIDRSENSDQGTTLELSPVDRNILTMNEIILDRNSYNSETGEHRPILNSKVKLELLGLMFDIDTTVDNIVVQRAAATKKVLIDLYEKKKDAIFRSRFGEEMDLKNQIARFRAGMNLTERDEQLIQAEVHRLLIIQTFKRYKRGEFEQHIQDNILSLQKQK